MHAKLIDWRNGWFGVELAIRTDEIERLVSLLQMIKSDPEQHFHLSSDYKGSGGLGDIEISIQPEGVFSNMESLGRAIAPGHEES
jgi:hypothetical protein